MSSPIPEARRPAVERALTAAFGTPVFDAIAPVSGGLSGAGVFRIRVGGIAYLLRLEGPADVFRDPARWYGCMRTAAEAFLAPRVRYADADDGVAIMDFISERSLALEYAGSKADLITDLAQTVRALHAAPPFPPLMDYLDGMEALIGRFRAGGLLTSQAIAEPLARYAELAAAYRGLAPDLVSSHNDLNPRNVLYDGTRLWLVDWESSFHADRYVDLATLVNFFAADPEEEALLLRVYFGRAPDAARLARLFLARQINHVFYAMSFLGGAAAERPDARLPEVRLEAPSVAELHRRLAAGEFDLDAWESRVLYGKARLIAAAEAVASPAFARAAALAA